MLELKNLHVAYGQSEVISDLNLALKPKEIIAIMVLCRRAA